MQLQPSPSPTPPGSRARWWRVGVAIAILIALVIAGHVSGVDARLTRESVRGWVTGAGGWGVALFIALFAAAELLHLPGMMFIAAGVLAWGRVRGGAVGYLAALASVTTSFVVVRAIGGRPLARLTHPRARALLARLERRPITTVLLLRIFLWLAPSVNYALALSSIRFTDYLLGSALGLALPIAVATALFGTLFH